MRYLFLIVIGVAFSCNDVKHEDTTLYLPGLQQPVTIILDEQGINHIYAQTEHDLFFAQGYCAARDRLFQFELWRRQASGTVAEIVGEREISRDIGTRLFKYRGDLTTEFNHYHPRGEKIINAFTDGINAWVKATEENPELLPVEFNLLGIIPGYWTPDLVISRHQGLLGNLTSEVATARAVALLGSQQVLSMKLFEPGTPTIDLDPSIDKQGLMEDIIALYEAYRKPIVFQPEDLVALQTSQPENARILMAQDKSAYDDMTLSEQRSIGSNNWIVSGKLSASGFPLLANDPHRALSAPSLRYMVHLNAPGWNVVGGGEPTIPGVSIGHNEHGAWGLTIFNIDGEDLMVYDLNPANPNQYRYRDEWENFTVIPDTIRVKDKPDVFVEHHYTRHGPVTFIDQKRKKAYAVRCAWLEPGGAPYLASLRMNVSTSWEEFREACSYSHIPGENMIWADQSGTIGWQAVGIAPVRKNWSGLVPVPGDGRYEWDGYLPIKSLPHVVNPEKGFWTTANENLIAPDYPHRNAVGWEWADSSRANRINEVLASRTRHTQHDMMALQVDYVSHPARKLVPYLKNLKATNPAMQAVMDSLLNWNFELSPASIAAGMYMAWERKLSQQVYTALIPEKGRAYIRSMQLRSVIAAIEQDHPALKGRDQFLLNCLDQALTELETKLGSDRQNWQYGQPAYHHVYIKHPMSNVVTDSLRALLDCGPLPRGGSGTTSGVTGNGDNQAHGATFRMVADLSDWDKTLFTNAPGQSGDIRSLYYNNLFETWAKDQFFPVYFSREKIEQASHQIIRLSPKK
jgi:penicillin G amidase